MLALAPAMGSAARGAGIIVDHAGSHLEIAVKSTIDPFVATLRDFEAAVELSPDGGQIRTAVFRCKFNAIQTGNPDRDHDMNDWQHTEDFPDVSFALTELTPGPAGRTLAHGRLRLHGVEKSVSFPVSVDLTKPVATIDGDVTLDTRDYGLPVIRKYLVLKVDPIVVVHFHLQGKRDIP